MTNSKVVPLVSIEGNKSKRNRSRGEVSFVGAGPGMADLITLRGYRRLKSADVILYDSLIDHSLLDECTAKLVYVGKRCGKHSMSQPAIGKLLVDYALEGGLVVRLKGGDPSVFGRLGEELEACIAHKIPFEVVPGISSSLAAGIFAGIPMTYRGVADSFSVVTAHKKAIGGAFSIPLYSSSTTVVLMMGKSTAALWQPLLLKRGYPPELPIAFVSNACTPEQFVVTGTVDKAIELSHQARVETPCTVVLGKVVGLQHRYRWVGDERLQMDTTLESPRVAL